MSVALADRQAVLTAAAVNGVKDYTPLDVDEQVAHWETWLSHDPGEDDRAIGELMMGVA